VATEEYGAVACNAAMKFGENPSFRRDMSLSVSSSACHLLLLVSWLTLRP
jgi:hypothetical protein